MSFSFLRPENLYTKYNEAKDNFEPHFNSFPEYERVANNEPKEVVEGQPDVTDGTVASFVRTRPRAIVQSVPSVKVELSNPELVELEGVFDELVNNKIIPNAATGGSAFSKSISAVRKGYIYGSQPALMFTRDDGNYFGADFELVGIRDVYLEPGKISAGASNYLFLNAWYTESDIDSIIATEKELAKDKDYKTEWDLAKLAELKDKLVDKADDSKTKAEREGETNQEARYAHIVYAYQVGVGATFYAFNPELPEDNVLKAWDNPDPRGRMPIEYYYGEEDGERPLGDSAIKIAIPSQNMLDRHLQNYQFQVGLKAANPVKVRGGSVDVDSVKIEPYAVWDMGADPNSDVSLVQLDNTVINTFPTTQGILKSNILNIVNNGDTSISAEVGNPDFSKTPAGVRALAERLDTNDNYTRRQFEDWFGRVVETMLNLHIAAHVDMEDKEVVPLSERYIEAKKRQNPNYQLSEETIDYSLLAGVSAKVTVDASSSKIDNDSRQVEILTALIERQEVISPYVNMGALVRQFIKKSGVENVDEIVLDDAEVAAQQQPEAGAELPIPPTNPEMPLEPQQPVLNQEIEPPLPPAPEPMPQIPQQPDELDQALVNNGLSPELAAEVKQALAEGASPEEIDQALRVAK